MTQLYGVSLAIWDNTSEHTPP